MVNTNLIFIKLHQDSQKKIPDEIFIDINKIIAISPSDNGGSLIYTIGQVCFYCKESIDDVMNLMDESFKNRIASKILK